MDQSNRSSTRKKLVPGNDAHFDRKIHRSETLRPNVWRHVKSERWKWTTRECFGDQWGVLTRSTTALHHRDASTQISIP